MKKIISIILALGMLMSTAYAYNFPEPDWGALLSHRRSLVNEKDFELYTEGSIENAPFYGAKLEPRAGAYIGTVTEDYENHAPYGSHLTYIEYGWGQYDLYYPSNQYVKNDNVIAMVGYNIASIDNVDYNEIRTTLDNLSRYGKPMIIRFANEMNCSNLGDDPYKYVEVFRTVANMIHEYPNFAVVWSPNDMGALDRPFEYFYPGDEYVDWIGVSCYMTKYFVNNKNTAEKDSVYFMTGDYAWATNKIKPLMEFLQEYNIQKPVMISEGAVARSNNYGDDYSGWNEPRMRNMLYNIIMKYPQIKMINYFNKDYSGDKEKYSFSKYTSSESVFSEAIGSGAYIREAYGYPDFVFSKASNGETLAADSNGIVNLYTLAYFPRQPEMTVNYRIDGEWKHSSNQIPYTYHLNINNLSDGEHTLSIGAFDDLKTYTFYKSGQLIRFGAQPDESAVVSTGKSGTSSAAEKEITVYVNGKKIEFDQQPVIIDERTLVPMRAIFEALGAEVEWNQEYMIASATRGNTTVNLKIGNNIMYKYEGTREEAVELDVPAQLISDRTMVPVRAIAEAFGQDVLWNGEDRSITITD